MSSSNMETNSSIPTDHNQIQENGAGAIKPADTQPEQLSIIGEASKLASTHSEAKEVTYTPPPPPPPTPIQHKMGTKHSTDALQDKLDYEIDTAVVDDSKISEFEKWEDACGPPPPPPLPKEPLLIFRKTPSSDICHLEIDLNIAKSKLKPIDQGKSKVRILIY